MPPSIKSGALLLLVALALSGCGGEDNPGAGEHFTAANWSQLVSEPEKHKGATAEIVGRVFTEPERDDEETFWQMWAKPKASEWNTVVGISDPDFEIKNGDYVRVRGTVTGEFKADNAFGAEVSGPAIRADKAEVVTALEAASPATETLSSRETTVGGVNVTVEKVELAPDETRVFVSVRNGSDAKFSLYSHTAKLIVAGKQLDSVFSPEGYPQLGSDIVAGAESSGVFVFPAVEAGEPLKLALEGYSSDSSIGEYGSVVLTFRWP